MSANMNHRHEPDTKSPCWLCVQFGYIIEEVNATKPHAMPYDHAVGILISERYDRDILTRSEYQQLMDSLDSNEWTEAEMREAWGK